MTPLLTLLVLKASKYRTCTSLNPFAIKEIPTMLNSVSVEFPKFSINPIAGLASLSSGIHAVVFASTSVAFPLFDVAVICTL